MRWRALMLTVVTVVALAPALRGVEAHAAGLAEITAPDGNPNDRFGSAVALDGETAAIGAPGDTTDASPGSSQGTVRVFLRSGQSWAQQAVLAAGDGHGLASFGHTVAIDGDTVVVGAPGTDGDGTLPSDFSGAAYVFVRQDGIWVQQQKLLPADPEPGKVFGSAVAIDGDTVVIGAYGAAGYAGAAYVFTRAAGAWTQQQKLVHDPGPFQPSQALGRAVAVDGDIAMIGAQGFWSAVPFVRTGAVWTQGAGIWSSSNGSEASDPGASIAVSGTRALVGDAPVLGGSGSAVVFVQHPELPEHWFANAELRVPVFPRPTERYGWSVALQQRIAVVGATGAGGERGSTYVFARDDASWSLVEHLTPPDGYAGEHFGSAVALSGNSVVIGAWDAYASAGAAYVYTNTDPVASDDTYAVDEDATVAGGVLGNDADAEGPTSARLRTAPEHGSLSLSPTGSFSYAPDPDYFGEDAFEYAACDTWERCDLATVTIRVRPLPDGPRANDDAFNVTEDQILDVTAPGVLVNDVEVDGERLRASPYVTAPPAHGSIDLREDGSFRYVPDADFGGTDGFTYAVVDDAGWSGSAQVRLDVLATNDAPVAADDAVATAQYATVQIDALANDADVDGDPLFISWMSQPEHGTAHVNEDGTISYVPGGTFKDGDSFRYVVSDGYLASAVATVRVDAIGCGEDGLGALTGTPAEGAASRIVDREIEPRLYRSDPALARGAHEANCGIVVAAEQALE